MAGDRARLGQVVAVTGAALLGLSVFMPWYGVTITSAGAAYAQGALSDAAARYGNATLQAQATSVGSTFTSIAGHQLGTVSAHQALKTVSVLLLILAGLAFLGALVWLAEIETPIEVSAGQIATVGVLATLVVGFRMIDRPSAPLALFALSLSWGSWLALLSAIAIVAGTLAAR
jgi:hypothetical protein